MKTIKANLGWLLLAIMIAATASAGVVKIYRGQVGFQESGIYIGTTLMTSTGAELNIMTGVTSTAAELNIMDGVSASAAELNVLDLSVTSGVHKIKKIAIASTPTGSEQDSAWDLPASAAVKHVWIFVTTAEATGSTKTLDIGTLTNSNDPDGWCDGVSVAATGFVDCVFLGTAGSSHTYVHTASSHTRGALLTELLIAGTDGANTNGDGVAVPGYDLSSGAAGVSYTSGSADFAEFRGAIYIEYIELE